MANDIANTKAPEGLQVLHRMLQDMKPQIAAAIPRTLAAAMTPERLTRVMMTAWSKTPDLQKCTPLSLAGAMLQASQLGLEVDPLLGQAYLVPYWNSKTSTKEAQLQLGYKGLIALVCRSKSIIGVPDGDCVYDGDIFEWQKGTNTYLNHRRGPVEDDAAISHAWAMVKFTGGGERFEVMSRAKIDKVRGQSKAADKGPWVTHFPEMAMKTPLRRLCKFLQLSPDVAAAIQRDELLEQGIVTSDGEVIDQRDVRSDKARKRADEIEHKLNGNGTGAVETPAAEQPAPSTMFDQDAAALADWISDVEDRIERAAVVSDLTKLGAEMTERKADLGAAYDTLLAKYQDKFRRVAKK